MPKQDEKKNVKTAGDKADEKQVSKKAAKPAVKKSVEKPAAKKTDAKAVAKSDAEVAKTEIIEEGNAPAKKPTLKLKVTEFDFALADISAGLIPPGMDLPKRSYWASCCWMPGESPEQRVAGLTVNTRLDWEGGLLVSLKYIVEFVASPEITAARLEKAVPEIMTPVWNDAAYVTSFITERFIGVPIIVPPQVEAVEFEEYIGE